jgi:NADH-quinone oxidoreductase subunit C
MTLPEVVDALKSRFTDQILGSATFRDEHTVTIVADAIPGVCKFCKDELAFDYLVDISSVDNMGDEPRFELVYELYSMSRGHHLRLKAPLPEDVDAPTVTGIWRTADWHEREVYDMMGIRFTDHPDLRRILMWDGFPYFPLRKDFPLEGKPSDMPDVAFSETAPLAGGPFVSAPSTGTAQEKEPRSREPR